MSREPDQRPLVVGIGGTTRATSSTERALRAALAAVEDAGGETLLLGSGALDLPAYAPERPERTPNARRLIEAIRSADGVIVASPGYHGGISGQLKNALDYLEDLRDDERPYLDGRAVGCVVCAYGWQATTTTLVSLRSVVHALRGWPTPLGVALNSAEPIFGEDGSVAEAPARSLRLMAEQVVEFARLRARVAA